MKPILLIAALALSVSVHAQNKLGQPQNDPMAGAPLLPERKDVVSWKTFAQVELVKLKDRYVPQFSSNVTALDSKEVKVQGFMLPLELGDKQSHFVLSAMPSTCSFCMPGGPEAMVEVKTKKPVKYSFDPLVLTGKLAVLKDDPTGIFYRLTDAEPAK